MTDADIDDHLRERGEPHRSTLEEMRKRTLSLIPRAEQTTSYSVPAFKVNGKTVAGLAAFTPLQEVFGSGRSRLLRLDIGRYGPRHAHSWPRVQASCRFGSTNLT